MRIKAVSAGFAKKKGTSRSRALSNYITRYSERKFKRELPDARIAGAGDLAKIAPDHVAIRILELSMIEHIEDFGAKLYCHSLADHSVLAQRHVPVVESRAVEEAPVRIAQDSDSLRRERRRIEELVSRSARVEVVDSLAVVVWNIRAVASAKRGIVALTQRNREACGKARDSRETPTAERLSLEPVRRS